MNNSGIGVIAALLLSVPAEAQSNGPALGNNRITQAAITSGNLSMRQMRRRGLEVFATPLNKLDGMGDGPVNLADPKSPGGRPTVSGTWLRVNGLDSQACNDCHSFVSSATVPPMLGVGGSGGITQTAFPGIQSFDLADANGDGIANIDGRVINPPFVFGSGGVELAGKEMTTDLQALRADAQANPNTIVNLVTKGVSFGSISFDATLGFDFSNLEGIDDDLVVRPFGRKGDNSSIRKFDTGALMFHAGMQPQEIVGTGVDGDGDGVVDEILVGELSALHIFSTNLERPVAVNRGVPSVVRGRRLFGEMGCADCHVPNLSTKSTMLDLTFPEVETDPTANVFLSIDLTRNAHFERNRQGGVNVPLFSDLKRHDLGPALHETTGSPLDPFFITPRLWGISDSAPYMHDGRALTLADAIDMHEGEAAAQSLAFRHLGARGRRDILSFLGSLRTPRNPSRDISRPVRLR